MKIKRTYVEVVEILFSEREKDAAMKMVEDEGLRVRYSGPQITRASFPQCIPGMFKIVGERAGKKRIVDRGLRIE